MIPVPIFFHLGLNLFSMHKGNEMKLQKHINYVGLISLRFNFSRFVEKILLRISGLALNLRNVLLEYICILRGVPGEIVRL